MFPQRAAGAATVMLLLILVASLAVAAGESTRYLALERIFVVIAIAAGISC